jgi:Flp pilus assembly protein TadG
MVKIGSLVGRFGKCQQGATAIVLAITAVPLMLAAGMGLDYVRASNLKTRMQSALDAAALAAAASPGMSDSERMEIARRSFDLNWRHPMTEGVEATPNFTISRNAVTAAASADMKTALMQLGGIDEIEITGTATVSIPEDKKAEIALVLDYSGSMEEISGGQVKYIAMRNAAKRLVDDLRASAPNRVKTGLVPFSHHVWVTLPKEYVRGQTGTGSWTGCTQDRRYPYNLSDATPEVADDSTKWGQPIAPTNHGGCSAYAPRRLIVKPLTDDLDSVNAQLDAMQPYAYTHIALGAEFGFHLLSPNAPFTGVAPYGDSTTGKVLVILTDGRQTEPAFGPNNIRNEAQGERNLSMICEAAKAKGITVMTVAFDLREEDTRERLRNCATNPEDHFFIAEDSAEVARAFQEIRTQITANIFISK